MVSTREIILEYVCPGLGVIICQFMFSAPYRDLKEAIDRGHIGDLNPTPWAFMLGNCLGWVTYSILLQNLWIFFANCPGFVLSIWLNLGAAKLLYQRHHSQNMRESFVHFLRDPSESQWGVSSMQLQQQQRQQQTPEQPSKQTSAVDLAKIVWDVTSQTTPAPAPHENMVMAIVLVWTSVISLICFAQAFDSRIRESIVGILVNFNLVFFYGAPLSTIYTVLRKRNSASIHIPTMITNTLNGSFWTAYGLAIIDPFIIVPNGLGALLGAIQISLILVFPRRSSLERNGEQEEAEGESSKDNESKDGPMLQMVEQPVESDAIEEAECDC